MKIAASGEREVESSFLALTAFTVADCAPPGCPAKLLVWFVSGTEETENGLRVRTRYDWSVDLGGRSIQETLKDSARVERALAVGANPLLEAMAADPEVKESVCSACPELRAWLEEREIFECVEAGQISPSGKRAGPL